METKNEWRCECGGLVFVSSKAEAPCIGVWDCERCKRSEEQDIDELVENGVPIWVVANG